MKTTGKTIVVDYQGKAIRVYNQRCTDWSSMYDWKNPPQSTLSNAGCGIFSTAVAIGWMSGVRVRPETLAVFALAHGARDDTGTDRPTLLKALTDSGSGERYGFVYQNDGLRNDLDALYAHLSGGCGTALCNLRPGHIVTLVQAREENGEHQVLAIDPYSESDDPRVTDNVRLCVPGSEIIHTCYNAQRVAVGVRQSYAMFWVALDCVRDFNLLHAHVRE